MTKHISKPGVGIEDVMGSLIAGAFTQALEAAGK